MYAHIYTSVHEKKNVDKYLFRMLGSVMFSGELTRVVAYEAVKIQRILSHMRQEAVKIPRRML